MKKPFIKICGITSEASLEFAAQAGTELVGFIFVPQSPRYVTLPLAEHLAQKARQLSLRYVTVFQDQSLEEVITITQRLQPDFIQLHGDEAPEFAQQLHFPIIKAIKTEGITDQVLKYFEAYSSVAKMFLLDRVNQGIGEPVPLETVIQLAKKYPLILAGGLTPDTIKETAQTTHQLVLGYDVSSGVERQPGIKDPLLITKFIENSKSFLI